MPYLWDDQAWADYQYWMTQDKKTLRRINALLKDLTRTGGAERGLGKGELLKYSSEGLRSMRIDGKNRLVCRIDEDVVRIVSCRGHYDDGLH